MSRNISLDELCEMHYKKILHDKDNKKLSQRKQNNDRKTFGILKGSRG